MKIKDWDNLFLGANDLEQAKVLSIHKTLGLE